MTKIWDKSFPSKSNNEGRTYNTKAVHGSLSAAVARRTATKVTVEKGTPRNTKRAKVDESNVLGSHFLDTENQKLDQFMKLAEKGKTIESEESTEIRNIYKEMMLIKMMRTRGLRRYI